jgi:hypothetical protein
LFAARVIIAWVGAVDWAAVWDSVARLNVVQLAWLLALLLLRQSLNAVPLARFVPGLSWWRSLNNDLAANLLGTVAPPPSDIVIRVAMFKSWGIDPVMGMAGVTLNMLAFYIVRFGAPGLALVVLAFYGFEEGQVGAALLSVSIALAFAVAVWLVARGEGFARWLGRLAGRLARRFRPDVDPDVWADSVADFRGRVKSTIRTGLAPSLLAMFAMVLVDSFIVFFALRFVGVGSAELDVFQVVTAFLLVYPLTLLPLFGFGVLDALLVAAYVEMGGAAIEPEVVAALIVWRLLTIGGPLLLGLLAAAMWKRSAATAAAAAV